MHLDVVIGESKPDNSSRDRQHIVDLAGRVRMLNDRLRDIRKEQQFQREREADFRDLSELTNSRAIWWSAIQAVVLIATGVWQLRHLTVFFNEKKLR
ncbi:membrane trafficking protein [Ceraceosorus bombacis]|nr:membrane trafficking protein [Ceraceosorus bombacis]